MRYTAIHPVLLSIIYDLDIKLLDDLVLLFISQMHV